MKFDQYTLHARAYPAVICVVPILLFVHANDDPTMAKLLSEMVAIQVVGQIGIGIAAFFLLMQLARTLGKDVFERAMFKSELYFPTTEFLLPNCSELSDGLKARIAGKVRDQLELEIPDMTDLETDETAARRQARDVVARIRGAAGKSDLLLQRNWEYGFYRNLAGGSVIALAASIFGANWHARTSVGNMFVVLTIAYLVILLSSRWLMRRSARHYARQLFYAFLGDER